MRRTNWVRKAGAAEGHAGRVAVRAVRGEHEGGRRHRHPCPAPIRRRRRVASGVGCRLSSPSRTRQPSRTRPGRPCRQASRACARSPGLAEPAGRQAGGGDAVPPRRALPLAWLGLQSACRSVLSRLPLCRPFASLAGRSRLGSPRSPPSRAGESRVGCDAVLRHTSPWI